MVIHEKIISEFLRPYRLRLASCSTLAKTALDPTQTLWIIEY
jgi:hypothetical protein